MALVVMGAQAQAIVLMPSYCSDAADPALPDRQCTTGEQNSNGDVNSAVAEYLLDMYGGITEVYKSEVVKDSSTGLGFDEKLFENSYKTTFMNTLNEPTEARIEYVGGPAIDCPSCWALVKDGKHQPAWYLFDISDWNGTETLYFENFWPGDEIQGAISHISIFGAPPSTSVPLPGPLSLLGIGLFGVCVRQLKKAS